MKKRYLSVILALFFVLVLFAGCGKSEVTEANVKELFMPTVECFEYYNGSALYELERDENGQLISYGETEGHMPLYKVVGFDSYDQILAEYRKYISEELKPASFPDERTFRKTKDGLLVARNDGGLIPFDPESIKLEKEENGKYYISVDEYEPSNTDNFDYVDTLLVTATYKDGILYCEKAERCYDEKKKDVLVRPENELLSTYQKFQ